MIDKKKLFSPTPQRDFIWLAEYYDGTIYPEFSFETGKANDFYMIDKDKLIKFGLIGHGYKFDFNIAGGEFNLLGRKISFVYKVDDRYYNLNDKNLIYNDLIAYRNAYIDFDPFGNEVQFNNPYIYQYNFGYKTKIVKDDIKFNFKVICHVPFNQPVYLEIGLVANQKLDGELLILRNEAIIKQVKSPLEKDISGMYNWEVR